MFTVSVLYSNRFEDENTMNQLNLSRKYFEDSIEKKLDLNQFLIKHPSATFFVRVEGDSMKGAGIYDKDLLIVDRALSPKSGQIVVAVLNGEFTVKRVKIKSDKAFLIPENPNFPPMEVTKDVDFQVWGVVTYAIHSCTV